MDGVSGGTIGFTLGTSGIVVNENSEDAMDFRVESTNDTHKLFVDSSADQVLVNTGTSSTIGGIISEFQISSLDNAQGTTAMMRFSNDAVGHALAFENQSNIS